MNITEIQAELDRLAPMISAKGIPAADLEYHIRANAESVVSVIWWSAGTKFNSKRFNSIAECESWINKLPTPEVAAMQRHNARLAELIDDAREDQIPDEYVTPLVVVREALSSNLLTVAE